MLAEGSRLGLVGMFVPCRVVEEDKEEEEEGRKTHMLLVSQRPRK